MMVSVKNVLCLFFAALVMQETSLAQQPEFSLTDLANNSDVHTFLNSYNQQIGSLFQKEEYDSVLVLLEKLENTKIADHTEVKANIALDRALCLNNKGEVEKSRLFYIDAVNLASQQPDKRLLAEAYFRKGKYFYMTSGVDSALYNLKQSLSIYKQLKDTSGVYTLLTQLGMLLDNNGAYSKALTYLLEGLKMQQTAQDSTEMSKTLNSIAIIYKKQDNLDAAKEYYVKALRLSELMGDTASTAVTNVNIGLLYKDLGRLKKADSILSKSLQFFIAKGDSYAQAIVYHNLGAVKLAEKELENAEGFFNTSLKLGKENHLAKVIALDYLFLAKVDFEQKRYQRALEKLIVASNFAEENQLLEEKKEISALMADTYEKLGNYELALDYLKKHMIIKDSLFNENNTETINRLKTEYEVTQKDLQIASLEKESNLKDGLVNAEKTNTRLLVSFIVVLFIFVIFLWLGNKNRAKLTRRLLQQKEQLAEQKEEIESAQESLIEKNEELERINSDKDEIIGVVAHDLRSPLNQVKGLLNIIKPKINDAGSVEMINMALKSTDILRDRVNRILDIEAINAGKVDVKLERLYPDNILDELLSHFSEVATHKQIKLVKEMSAAGNDMFEADRNYLFQVLENLLSNAIKYSPKGRRVWVGASKAKEQLIFSVKDEGPGIAEEEQQKLFQKFTKLSTRPTANEDSSGLGLSIVKKYVDAMGGEVWCESRSGVGSSFFVAFSSL